MSKKTKKIKNVGDAAEKVKARRALQEMLREDAAREKLENDLRAVHCLLLCTPACKAVS